MRIPSGVIGGLIAAVLLAWAFGSSPSSNPGPVLRHGARYQLLAFSLFGFGALIAALIAKYPSPDQELLSYVTAAFFSCAGLWLVLDALLVKVRMGRDHLEVRAAWWRRARLVPWSKIISYSPSVWKHYYYIHTQGHGRLHVPELPGLWLVLDRIDRKHSDSRVSGRSRLPKPSRRMPRKRHR